MSNPNVTLTALKPTAPLATAADLYLVVTVSCPPAAPSTETKRGDLNLSLALDRSGSMRNKPLAEAKACAKYVVEQLTPRDRIAIVAYDHSTNVVVPPTAVIDKASILRAIDSIEVRGNTDVHRGWIAAAEAAALGLSPERLTRVLVLSDGNSTAGLRDDAAFEAQTAALADRGISTSTIGLGYNFNEDLMTALARAGQGQASYGETAEDLWPSFEAEFGLISATCGKNVRLRLSSPCGGRVMVENDYRKDGSDAWILPNLAHGAEVTALVRVSVQGLQGAEADVLDVSVCWDGTDGVAAAPLTASVKMPLVSFADFVIGLPDAKVAERVKESEAAHLQLAAKRAAAHRDFGEVRSIAGKLGAMAGDNAWIAGMAGRMAELAEQGDSVLLSKEATYASRSLRSSYTVTEGAPEELSFTRKRARQGKAD